MAKKILILACVVTCIFACQKKEEGFTITGSLTGNAEGGRVLLQDYYAYPPVTIKASSNMD